MLWYTTPLKMAISASHPPLGAAMGAATSVDEPEALEPERPLFSTPSERERYDFLRYWASRPAK